MKPLELKCQQCGYDLKSHRKQTAACPECGTTVSQSVERIRESRISLQRHDKTTLYIFGALAIYAAIHCAAFAIAWMFINSSVLYFWTFSTPLFTFAYVVYVGLDMGRRGLAGWKTVIGLFVIFAVAGWIAFWTLASCLP
jgi:predicted RNA-binding Zn-ribbon protein involved in translation (DUF1610 family)